MNVATGIALLVVALVAVPGVRAIVAEFRGTGSSCGDCKGCAGGTCDACSATDKMLHDIESAAKGATPHELRAGA